MDGVRRNAKRRATIKNVAATAGVSVSTVSNVLNGRYAAMTDDTLRRVQEAMTALSYRRSELARGLVTHRSSTIGLLMVEIETPLFLQALHVIEPSLRRHDHNLLLSVANGSEQERQALNFLLEKQADGFIFFSTTTFMDDSHLLDLMSTEIPVVLVNRARRHPQWDQIDWDNTGGIMHAVEHLARLGHRRIAFMRGPDERRSTIERLGGYRQALATCEIPYEERLVMTCDFSADPLCWTEAAQRVLSLWPRPTAVVASDDSTAAVFMRFFQRAGLRMPEDLAIVGVDDQPYAAYLNPALTTVRLPVVRAGELAVDMLLDRLIGGRNEPHHVMLPCELIVRESCGAHLGRRDLS